MTYLLIKQVFYMATSCFYLIKTILSISIFKNQVPDKELLVYKAIKFSKNK